MGKYVCVPTQFSSAKTTRKCNIKCASVVFFSRMCPVSDINIILYTKENVFIIHTFIHKNKKYYRRNSTFLYFNRIFCMKFAVYIYESLLYVYTQHIMQVKMFVNFHKRKTEKTENNIKSNNTMYKVCFVDC